MKFVSKTLVAAIAAIGLHGAAQAVTVDLGALPLDSTTLSGRSNVNAGFLGVFAVADHFKFSLQDSNPLSTFNLNVDGVLARSYNWLGQDAAFRLYSVQDSNPVGSFQSFAAGAAQYTGLTAGDYFVRVLGGGVSLLNRSGAGNYDLSFAATAVTPPVPEASEWAMLMAGLGVVGAIARRRQKKAA